jgi:glutamate synthase (NADPH/NADH) large chain
MTGGIAVILGDTGGNFGAGMTGGMAFILDPEGKFESRANPDSIIWQRLDSAYWEAQLKALIAEHAEATDSQWSNSILDDWDRRRSEFWQVCPKEMLTRLDQPLSDAVERVAAE